MDRILIADDHPLVRSSIAALIMSTLPGCRCSEAGTLGEAKMLLEEGGDFDLITLDLDLPDAKQLYALSELRRLYPAIPIAILSGNRDAALARAAMAAGASGFISKMQKPEALLTALRTIREEGVYHDPEIEKPAPEDEEALARVASLTPQQTAVYRLVVEGRLNKQIAFDLDISLTTVKAHVSAILAKLSVASRTQAVILAKRYGLFS